MLAAPPFSLLENLNAVDDALDSNAEIAESILAAGLQAFGLPIDPEKGSAQDWRGTAKTSDLAKAHSTIRQFYRDWSAEGRPEREICYRAVLQDLRQLVDRQKSLSPAEDFPLKVLVPGAGLGRLVFELCQAGFKVEGNEISYHQLLASSWILNHINRNDEYPLYPFASQFTNLVSRHDQLRQVLIPDVHPAEALASVAANGNGIGEMNMTAADFVVLYGGEDQQNAFDAVATVFFIDTAPNFIRYVETVHHCLKRGGLWTNIGPLLWHFDDRAPGKAQDSHGSSNTTMNGSGFEDRGIGEPGSFELTDEEVIVLLEGKGFQIESREILTEGAGYLQNPDSMLQNMYRVSHWIAKKL